MTIHEHLTQFDGRPIVDYSVDTGITSPETHAFRLALDWDAYDNGRRFVDLLADFLADPMSAQVEALVIGDWGHAAEEDSSVAVEGLVVARDRLPKLKALFLGEITAEECEISWIIQSDVSALFEAFGNLEVLHLRGGNGLRLGRPRQHRLRKLVIETGGMSADMVADVTSGDLPSLDHLELWLGDDGYGNTVTLDDLGRLLASGPCQKLVYLGLRDDCRADASAKWLAGSAVPATLRVLDLSMGTLSDEGADALAASPWLKQLKKLDIHFHYVSAEAVARLARTGVEVDADLWQEPHMFDGVPQRYVAVGE